MLVVWVFVALASFNTGNLTLGLSDVACLVDEKGTLAVVDADGRIIRGETSSWSVGADKKKKKDAQNKKKRESDIKRAMDDKKDELDWSILWNEGTDAVLDVPIGGVCEVLYGHIDDMPEDHVV